MVEFLSDDDLALKIRHVMDGEDVCCVVAYWSDHGFDVSRAREWKIVCDIHSGSTSPRALRNLHAPDNENLFYLRGLHSKVYLSDLGAVVGSANASNRALCIRGPSRSQVEAGIFAPKDSDLWNNIKKWTEDKTKQGNKLDEAALRIAEISYLRRGLRGDPDCEQHLADMINHPCLYEHVSFVFYWKQGSKKEIDNKIEKMRDANKIKKNILKEIPLQYSFYGWSEEEVSSLKKNIVSIYKGPRGAQHVTAHRLDFGFPTDGLFFTSKAESLEAKTLCDSLGKQKSTVEEIIKILESGLLKGDDGAVLDAKEFFNIYQEALINQLIFNN